MNFQFLKFFLITVVFITALLNTDVPAQNATVDATFNPVLTQDATPSSTQSNIAVQPDGKIIIFGSFSTSVPSGYVKRLNSDGSIDTSFNCTVCETFNIEDLAIQTDGKIVVAAYSGNARFIRLNTDGSQDQSLNINLSDSTYNTSSPRIYGFQPDGKIIVRYYTHFNSGYHTDSVIRINTDGSIDNTFNTIAIGGQIIQSSYATGEVQPDGKILLVPTSSSSSQAILFRYNTDGTRDTAFESPSFGSSSSSISDLAVYPDGRIMISGLFSSVNSLDRRDLVRLFPAGNVDTSFTASASVFANDQTHGGKIKILPDGKILFATAFFSFTNPSPTADNRLFRLNIDGSLDSSFNPPAELTRVGNFIFDSSGRVLVFGVYSGVLRYLRLNSDGSFDSTFNASTLAQPGTVKTLAVQPDGKILVIGEFNRVAGVLKSNFTRLNADGSADNTFDTGSGFNIAPSVIVLQADGKILAGGTFTSFNGTNRNYIVRLNQNGSLDAAFNPIVSASIKAIAVQADGKILIGGAFSTVNGATQSALARLNSDGSLDAAFNPTFGNGTVYAILVQADGKIMVGGAFSGVNGFNRSNFVRLNSDSTLDSAFNASVSIVNQIIRQPDGKYLIITSSNTSVSRRNSDGTADSTFQTLTISSGVFYSIYLQPDGKIIVGGAFSSPRRNILRLAPNGVLDSVFLFQGTNGTVNALAAQPNGSLLVGGLFTTINNVTRYGIARILFTPFQPRVNFDYDGDGKADISVFRPSENKWYVLRSSDSGVTEQVFAIAGDVPIPADYDGDGKTDFAIFRPSSADWWSLYSSNGTQAYAHWGQSGIIPRPSDFDGDGRADYIFFLPSNSTWYRYGSSVGPSYVTFGLMGDKPVTGDFDGDGKTDVAIFRPSTGDWWWQSSVDNVQRATHWGISTDLPAPADYDGDGKTDFAVFRPSEGNWYVFNSSNFSYTILHWGISEDKPAPADYDGDGKADIAVFRPSTGVWYLLRSSAGFLELPFGMAGDIPTPNSFVPQTSSKLINGKLKR